jgi:geranyl-CoA carboxylase alpha subunit
MRETLGRDAVAAARAVGYVGAGTVEFIVDAEGRHHFLEMNTRLQVEHPVTECVTGLDLVEWQLRVAAGEPLPPFTLQMQGHAIEARLYAEDPARGWQPQTGRVLHWRPQDADTARARPHDAGVRIDHGLAEGSEVTPHYDAMVAKFIAHGRDRGDAIRRLRRALADAPLLGLATNAGFLRDLLAHPDFAAGDMTTARLDAWAASGDAILQPVTPPDDLWRVAAAVLGGAHRGLDLHLHCGGTQRTLRAPADGVCVVSFDDHRLTVDVDGVQRRFHAVLQGDTLHLAHDGRAFVFQEPSPWPGSDERPDPTRVRAPVAGTLVALKVAAGDTVAAGQPLACVEAMKMEMWLPAAAPGTVVAVHRQPRSAVAAGDLLIELDIQA